MTGDGGEGRPAGHAPQVRLPDGRRAGVHMQIGHGLAHAAKRAGEIGATALQIFADNPTAWRRRAAFPADADRFRASIAELGLEPLAIHAPYLVNLGGPNDDLFERSVSVLSHEYAAAAGFGARFVNVHAGSHRGSGPQAGTARIAEGVARAADAADGANAPLLVIENSSGGGDALGVTIADLEAILVAVASRGADARVAFCLDTAHLWGAGYDVGSPAAVDAVLAEFAARIGLERLAMIHFNDSHSARGSRHDRHAHLGEGTIGLDGMAHLLRAPALAHVAYYLELPGTDGGRDALNLRRLEELAAGRPLSGLAAAMDPERAGAPDDAGS